MKSFPKICAIGLVALGTAGFCLRASAQTNATGRAQEDPRRGPSRREEGTVMFIFSGGTPMDFVRAATNQCKEDWATVVTIPPEMENVQVPKIRLRVNNVDDAKELLELYNHLGEQNPSLGKWVWEGPAFQPVALMLVPSSKTTTATNAPVAAKEPEMEVKVFMLSFISGTNLAAAAEAIKATADVDQRDTRAQGLTPAPSHVVVDERTCSIIVTGSKDFVETAGKLLQRLDFPTEPPKPAPGQATGQASRGGRQ